MTEKATKIIVKFLDGSERGVVLPAGTALDLSIVNSVILKGRGTNEELPLVRRQGGWQEVSKEELEELWELEARAEVEAETRIEKAAEEEIPALPADEERPVK